MSAEAVVVSATSAPAQSETEHEVAPHIVGHAWHRSANACSMIQPGAFVLPNPVTAALLLDSEGYCV